MAILHLALVRRNDATLGEIIDHSSELFLGNMGAIVQIKQLKNEIIGIFIRASTASDYKITLDVVYHTESVSEIVKIDKISLFIPQKYREKSLTPQSLNQFSRV